MSGAGLCVLLLSAIRHDWIEQPSIELEMQVCLTMSMSMSMSTITDGRRGGESICGVLRGPEESRRAGVEGGGGGGASGQGWQWVRAAQRPQSVLQADARQRETEMK